MANLVTLEEAKLQLRVTWSDEDAYIQLLLDASEAAVLDYIKRDWDWDSQTVPVNVKLAILVMLATYFDPYRDGDDFSKDVALGYPPPAVTSLVHRYRSPAYA